MLISFISCQKGRLEGKRPSECEQKCRPCSHLFLPVPHAKCKKKLPQVSGGWKHIWISVSRSSPLPLPPAVWAVLTPTSREDHASPHCTAMECMARGLISERSDFIIIYSLRAGNSVPINTEPPHLSKETPVDSLLTGNNICSRDETPAQEAEEGGPCLLFNSNKWGQMLGWTKKLNWHSLYF